MKIDDALIKRVAEIARIDLESKEIKKFKKDFDEILGFFSEIDSIDAKLSEPFSELKNQFRDDVVEKSLSKEEVFKNTKNREGDFFKSPRIK